MNAPQYIVLARDNLRGWVEGQAVRDLKSETMRGFFMDKVVMRYGVTSHVVTDNGTEFAGSFKAGLARFQIPRVTTSAYNPAANGVVERGNGPIKEAIWKMVARTGQNWWEVLDLAMWADRTTVRRSTGRTPYFLMFGQECVLPVDTSERGLMMVNWENVKDTADLLEARMVQLSRRREELEAARVRVQLSRQRSVYDHNAKWEARQMNRDFVEGDLVLVRESSQDKSHKVKDKPKWTGPFKVRRRTAGGAYVLEELNGVEMKERISHGRVRRFYERQGALQVLLDEIDGDIEPRLNDRPFLADTTDERQWGEGLGDNYNREEFGFLRETGSAPNPMLDLQRERPRERVPMSLGPRPIAPDHPSGRGGSGERRPRVRGGKRYGSGAPGPVGVGEGEVDTEGST